MKRLSSPAFAALVSSIVLLLLANSINAQPSFWDDVEQTATEPTKIIVYRSESCGCCKRWIEHLEKHNFIIEDHIVSNPHQVKQALGLPYQLGSCHTAIVNDYVIEGHVPAQDIKTLIAEKPKHIAGLSAPQMPHGTPGMETGLRYDDFSVLSYSKQNKISVFSSYKHINNGQYQKQNP
jgi:hypothetical protein